jgi:hypothetical protein
VLDLTQSQAAIATLGEEGLIAFGRTPDSNLNPENWQTRLSAQHVPALAPFAVDQLGCGDSLLAAATLTLAALGPTAMDSLVLAAFMGSIAAAAQAQRLGNAVIGAADLRRGARRLCNAHLAYFAEPASSHQFSTLHLHDQLPAAHA